MFSPIRYILPYLVIVTVISGAKCNPFWCVHFAEATIGFASTTYTYAEGVHPVCVTLMNGTLQDNVVITYSVFNISTGAKNIV